MIEYNKALYPKQVTKLKQLVDKYDSVFARHNGDLGLKVKIPFEIKTQGHEPIPSRQYRIFYAQQEVVDTMIDEVLTSKVISPFTRPWASLIVIVKKKDGSPRFCVDFRKINKTTIKDKYPLPTYR